MALQKSIDTLFGISAAYWNIVETHEQYGAGVLHVKLFGYPSKKISDDAKACLADITVSIAGEAYKPDMSRKEIYDYLKTLPELAGSIDA